jgi:hypothetical protein
MSKYNNDYILPGDDKNVIISKTNRNFNNILSHAVGERGEIGEIGATGIIGQAGRDGQPGATGNRATEWYFQPDEPEASVSQNGDIWINIGPTGAQQVFEYTSGSWVDSGESLLTAGVFKVLPGASGPGGSTENNVVVINDPVPNPADTTLVISDAEGFTGSINPNLAKMLISVDSSMGVSNPILGMAKTFIPQENLPGFYFESPLGTNYNTIFDVGSESTIISSAASFGSTGGTHTIEAGTDFYANSAFNITFNSGTSAGSTGNISVSTPGVFNVLSSSLVLDSAQMISNPTGIRANGTSGTFGYVRMNSFVDPQTPEVVYLNTSLNGIKVNAIKSSAGTAGVFRCSSDDGNYLQSLSLEDRGFLQIGNTSGSYVSSTSGGATGGKLIKSVDVVNSSFSSTFSYGGFTNNFVSISPSKDVILINPTGTIGSVKTKNRINRVCISLGSSFSWLNLSQGKERTVDIIMNSNIYAFGGIRTIPTSGGGGSGQFNFNEITDPGGNSATVESSCRWIRLTFFNSREDFLRRHYLYSFYSGTSGINLDCGWINWSSVIVETGGGAGGD